MRKTYLLVVLDGWGLGPENDSNAIYRAEPATFRFIQENFPGGGLQASGIAAGLPWHEVGNSEVGHLNLGAGRIVYQHYPRILMAIEDGTFFKNTALLDAFSHTRETGGTVHLIGLLTAGNVHASLAHLEALIKMAAENKCIDLALHLFTDGRDSPPRSALQLIAEVRKNIQRYGIGAIASIAGRYYGMDRDENWDFTERVYRMLIGNGVNTAGAKTAEEIIETSYQNNRSDEFIIPEITKDFRPIKKGDAIIFFNFREDRMRQLAAAFIKTDFSSFHTEPIPDLYVATMTEYASAFTIPVAFPRETITNSLGEVLAQNGKIQLRIAESVKSAHVTYFFNGLREEPFPNEFRVIVPSEKIARLEEHPEMMARALTDRALSALTEQSFDFILINYANPDMVAHTGNYDATIAAIRTVDRELKRLVDETSRAGHTLIVTADHGNAEELLDLKTGKTQTEHDLNPVPFYIVDKKMRKAKPIPLYGEPVNIGLLSDVAPTILKLMGLPQPPEMTGLSLLEQIL